MDLNFAFIMCLGIDGDTRDCTDAEGHAALALPGQTDIPPAPDHWWRGLLACSKGSLPGMPQVLTLQHRARDALP